MVQNSKNREDKSIRIAILYALYAVSELGNTYVSRIALQKLLYLSKVFAPLKKIVLDYLRFQYYIRGPYIPDLLNIIDNLAAQGFVKIDKPQIKKRGALYVNYCITEAGKQIVLDLIDKVEDESEKFWWISTITKLSLIYTKENYLSKYNGLDKIVDLVYQEPTFLISKKKRNNDYKKRFLKKEIDFELNKDTINELITFTSEFVKRNNIIVTSENEKRIAEIILIGFFEYLYVKVLSIKHK